MLSFKAPVDLYLNDTGLISVSNGAAGILVGTGAVYNIHVPTYAAYVEYSAMTDCDTDGVAETVNWYINGVLVEEGKAVVTDGDNVAKAITSTTTEVKVVGNADLTSGADLGGANEITFVGTGADGSSIDLGSTKNTASGKSLTFKDLTIKRTSTNYAGFHHSAAETYINCTIEGELWTYGTDVVFENCTFVQPRSDKYNIWTYTADKVTFNTCTFESAGKSVLIYNECGDTISSQVATFNDCTFKASTPVEGKAAIEIDSSCLDKNDEYFTVNINGNTTATGFAEGSVSKNTLYNVKKDSTDKARTTIVLNGEQIIADGLTQNVETKAYSVSNANGLALCGGVDGYFKKGGTFNITATIDMTGKTYVVPTIKTAALTINGQGNAIENLTVEGGTYAALLGRVSKSVTIDNLTIANSTFAAEDDKDGEYTSAAFVAWAEVHESSNKVIIKNSTVDNVKIGSSKYVGGFVAYQSGIKLTIDGCTIKNSTITNDYYDAKDLAYKGHAGGVVGHLYNGIIENTTVENTQFHVEGARYGAILGTAQDTAVIGAGNTVKNVTFNGVKAVSVGDAVGAVDSRADKTTVVAGLQ
ncbi:MAG: hypothetical protein IJX88_03375 [Clostridia bacterium]|nr:hypothetical protein [Clostridia bacterium]